MLLEQTEQPIEVTIRIGYNMNINDKMLILNSRIDLHNINLEEHNRILNEELHLLQPGDKEVLTYAISNIESILRVLDNVKVQLNIE